MTEAEAWELLRSYERELPTLNALDPFEILCNSAPVELLDEDGEPTGEWDVHVGWHCWAIDGGLNKEYGHALSVSTPNTPAANIWRLMYRNYRDTMGTVVTGRQPLAGAGLEERPLIRVERGSPSSN